MEEYVTVLVLTSFIGGSLYLFVRYPAAKALLPLIRWLVRAAQVGVDHWGFKRAYSDKLVFSLKYANLAEALIVSGTDLREARKHIATFVACTYNQFYPDGLELERAKHVALSGYMAILSHKEIAETIQGLQDHKNLDVRKATYVAIDILGELFDCTDKLSKEYFQHLVYGINKCLITFRDGGRSEAAYKEIYATLWRMYQLTKAFNKLKADEGLSKKEFYEKLTLILDAMLDVIDSK